MGAITEFLRDPPTWVFVVEVVTGSLIGLYVAGRIRAWRTKRDSPHMVSSEERDAYLKKPLMVDDRSLTPEYGELELEPQAEKPSARSRVPDQELAGEGRDEAKLKSGASTIAYEIRMLLVGYKVIARTTPATKEHTLALEAFLIHVRNLLEFFGKKTDSDTIQTRHFVDQLPPVDMPYLRSNGKRLHKMLAHPSYSRPRLKKPWQVDDIASELRTAMSAFLDRLEEEHPGRSAWFEDTPEHLTHLEKIVTKFSGTITDSYPSPSSPIEGLTWDS